MTLIAWSDAYSIGVPEIDAQHKRLIALLNEFHEAMSSGEADRVVDRVLGDLVQYARSHFAAEERLMQSAGYPGYAAHKAEHERLTIRILEYQAQDGVAGRLTISLDVLWFLWNWLQHHISESDKAIGAYIASSLDDPAARYGFGNAPSSAI